MRPAPLLFFCALVCLSAAPALGRQSPARLAPKQLAKAEALLDALGRAAARDASDLRKLHASISNSARSLPEGDLRADIETAARLLEPDAGARAAVDIYPLDCAGERPGAYRRLCEESATGEELRRRKALLHVGWARSLVRRERGAARAADAEVLAEAESERGLERRLAEAAYESLRELGQDVVVYRTRADFEDGGTLARVSFGDFEGAFAPASRSVRAILGWLPETRLKAELRNALRSYADGRFWWSKLRCARVVDASGDCVTRPERQRLGPAFPETFGYTVAVNWRNAARHLERAAQLLGRPADLLTQKGAPPATGNAPAALYLKP